MSDLDTTALSRPRKPPLFIVFLGALVGLGPLTVDAYLPALPTMASTFATRIEIVNYTVSLYLVGFGIGQFFGGALSDQIGRKAVGLLGLGVYVFASASIVQADSIATVLAMRIVQALGGGFATVVALAAIRDMYRPSEAGEKFAAVMMIMLLAPLLAPAGGAVLLTHSWQAIFVALSVYGVLLIAWLGLGIPETRPGPRLPVSFAATFRQCFEVVNRRIDAQRIPACYAFAMALGAAVLMVFLANASFVYIEYFGFAASAFPLFFGASAAALMVANLTSMKLLRRVDPRRLFRIGCRLQWSAVTALLVLTLLDRITIVLFMPLIMLGVGCIGIINPAGNAVYMAYFKQLSGSAASVFTTALFVIGSGLGALTSVFFDSSLVPMTTLMFAASTVSNLLARRAARAPMPQRD